MQTLKKSARISKLEGKAANAPRPTQLQRKALTCSCSVESSGGSYGKDRTWRRNSIRPNQTKRRSYKEADERVHGQEAERPGKPYCGWRPSSFESEQARCSDPSI